jgi:hypothetical protein
MKIRKLKTDHTGDPIYSWEKGWNAGPRLIVYRPVCWLLGHQPQDYELHKLGASGRVETRIPYTACSLCGKEFPRAIEVPTVDAPVATVRQIEASRERLMLGRGLSYEQARRFAGEEVSGE